MNEGNLKLATGLVDAAYIKQGAQGLQTRQNLVKVLLSQRRLPKEGWDDASIEHLLSELALMDSNNFVDNVGVGEREARVSSSIVSSRHYRLCHGIGRSGDIAAVQPKAAGSSLVMKLTNILALELLKVRSPAPSNTIFACYGLRAGTVLNAVPRSKITPRFPTDRRPGQRQGRDRAADGHRHVCHHDAADAAQEPACDRQVRPLAAHRPEELLQGGVRSRVHAGRWSVFAAGSTPPGGDNSNHSLARSLTYSLSH